MFDVEQCAENIMSALLLEAEGASSDEMPEIDILGAAIFFVDAEFRWLECNFVMFEWDTVFSVSAGPAALHPASIGGVGASPAVGGLAWGPVGDVEPDEDVAFFK